MVGWRNCPSWRCKKLASSENIDDAFTIRTSLPDADRSSSLLSGTCGIGFDIGIRSSVGRLDRELPLAGDGLASRTQLCTSRRNDPALPSTDSRIPDGTEVPSESSGCDHAPTGPQPSQTGTNAFGNHSRPCCEKRANVPLCTVTNTDMMHFGSGSPLGLAVGLWSPHGSFDARPRRPRHA